MPSDEQAPAAYHGLTQNKNVRAHAQGMRIDTRGGSQEAKTKQARQGIRLQPYVCLGSLGLLETCALAPPCPSSGGGGGCHLVNTEILLRVTVLS